ncbi:MAG TPA: hypothetical protein VF103_11690, partial [Polyangiaceae bacterium]
MRCEAHGLALGPDGRCVLCRDTERAAGVPSAKIGAMLAAGVVFVALAGLALYAVRPKPRVEAELNVDAR